MTADQLNPTRQLSKHPKSEPPQHESAHSPTLQSATQNRKIENNQFLQFYGLFIMQFWLDKPDIGEIKGNTDNTYMYTNM
jgi:hypothetical protein